MGGSVSYGGGKWPSSRGYGRPSCLTDNEQGKGKVQLIFQVGLFESVKSGSIHRAIYISISRREAQSGCPRTNRKQKGPCAGYDELNKS